MTTGTRSEAIDGEIAQTRHELLVQNVRSSTLPTLLVGALLAGSYAYFEGLPEAWWWW